MSSIDRNIEFPDNASREAASKAMYEAGVNTGVRDENNSSNSRGEYYSKLNVNVEEASGNLSKIRDIAELYGGKVEN